GPWSRSRFGRVEPGGAAQAGRGGTAIETRLAAVAAVGGCLAAHAGAALILTGGYSSRLAKAGHRTRPAPCQSPAATAGPSRAPRIALARTAESGTRTNDAAKSCPLSAGAGASRRSGSVPGALN